LNRTYDRYAGSELEIAELIQQRRLQLLVHSCIYYELNMNVISDKKWDEWAKELVQLQNDYPDIANYVDWHEAFKDWDASTGAFLPLKDKWVMKKARQICGVAVKQQTKPVTVVPKQTKATTKKNTGKISLF
jgi:hypothetical protein